MQKTNFSDFLTGLTSEFTPVVDAGFSVSDYVELDLSVNNQELFKRDLSSAESIREYISEILNSTQKKVGWGGYNELRGLYRRSDLFSAEMEEDLKRNIHLGIDLWADAGTAVLAVLDAEVHSFRDNDNFGDYGPTIILQHEIGGRPFYTLYGHLSRASLEGLKEGESIQQGQVIGYLGEPEENGDYAPHLHFQVIEDLRGQQGDFPGVTSRKEQKGYLQNCPDPNLLLKIKEI